MLKISIIVPVYNVKSYLAECIESVLKQTYRSFELILVNDGSTDGSDEICNKYVSKYPEHIRTINIKNSGPLCARITGIRAATGDVLVFLDSDDTLSTFALEKIIFCFLNNDCDMVMYDAGVCEEFLSLPVIHPYEKEEIFNSTSKEELYKNIFAGEIPNSVWLKAIKSHIANIPDRLFKCNLKHGEDLILSAHFIMNSKNIVYLNENLYYYRIREGSAVRSFDLKRKEALKIVHAEIEKCIALWDLPGLKSLHNTRKVKGWIENLLMLIKNKRSLSADKFEFFLKDMAEDSYFLTAYSNMDGKKLSKRDRFLAYCLFKRLYFVFHILGYAYSLANKLKIR